MNRLPILPLERRQEIAGLPATRAVHDRLFEELRFLSEVEIELPPADPASPADSFRVIAWNAERCRRVDGAGCFLQALRADLILLTEMDWGMARSGQLHSCRALAERLQCGYTFAIEFIELGLGDEEERKRWEGQDNAVGYHGAAMLFRRRPLATRVVRLERSAGWFALARGERRVGGRIALLTRFELSGVSVTFASVHLESNTDPADRAAQMRVVFDAIESYDPGAPVLIGGDLNTFSMSRAELEDGVCSKQALTNDPDRLLHPIAYEPLFDLARGYGYTWESANRMRVPTKRPLPRSFPDRPLTKIDWFLVRGLEVSSPEVIAAVDPRDGSDLSDHEAIAVTIKAGGAGMG
jgi:endonuclease/exonuclease/phosphatase family metal-dependent hydrolase